MCQTPLEFQKFTHIYINNYGYYHCGFEVCDKFSSGIVRVGGV